MPGQVTLPNFVYRPSASLRRPIVSTPQSLRGSRLVMLVTWPGIGCLDESSYIEHGI